jgi:hypothetical protein
MKDKKITPIVLDSITKQKLLDRVNLEKQVGYKTTVTSKVVQYIIEGLKREKPLIQE